MIVRKLLATAALVLATGAQVEPVTPTAPASIIHAQPALWVVRDSDTTIYLFGTVHKLKPGTQWLEGRIRQALAEARTLVVEADMSDAASVPAALKAHSLAHDGKTMIERLPVAERAPYRARVAELGLPEKVLDRLQPWAVAQMMGSMIVRKHGLVREEGVDDQLIVAAKATGKHIEALETIDQEFALFEAMPEDTQVDQLVAMLHDKAGFDEEWNKLATDWAHGRADRLAHRITAAMPPAERTVLLHRRNERWAARIKDMLDKPGTFFISVGSAHLAGKDSVRDDLRRLRIKSARLQ